MGKPVRCALSIEGEGPPVILVHGIGAARQNWDGLIKRLRHEFRCISYDLRGHGVSPMPAVPYSLDDLVGDLALLQEDLKIPRAHIVGHSLGGMIGPAYARLHPDRVASLGILSTAAFRTEEDSTKVKAVVASMRQKGIGPVLEALKDRWFTPEFAAVRPDVIRARLDQVMGTNPQVFLSVFDIYAETEMAPWIAEVKTPSLVLTGEHDGGCPPRLNQQIAAAIEGSELVILPGLRHAILLEAADKVADPVLAFLRKQVRC